MPDFFYLLIKLSLDKEVSLKSKAILASVIGYYILPFDLMPEIIIGPLGYLDDLALAAFILNNIINETSSEIVEKYWLNNEDLLDTIKKIIKSSDEMLGSGLWKRIKKYINKKSNQE